MRIALLFNPLSTVYPHDIRRINTDRRRQVSARISQALLFNGHEVIPLDISHGRAEIRKQLLYNCPDIVFYQSARVDPHQPRGSVPALLERMRVPYTGSAPTVCRAAQNKRLAIQLLAAAGLPAPDSIVLKQAAHIFPSRLPPFPLFVKPLKGSCSIGIPDINPVSSVAHLKKAVLAVLQNSRQPALVESFINGREFTVGIIGNQTPRALPIMEFVFEEGANGFRSFTSKIDGSPDVAHICPAVLSNEEKTSLERMALAAYHVLGCRDYARVDLRCDGEGWPYVLEVNAHPSLFPASSLPRMAEAGGISYEGLLEAILMEAALRCGIASAVADERKESLLAA